MQGEVGPSVSPSWGLCLHRTPRASFGQSWVGNRAASLLGPRVAGG